MTNPGWPDTTLSSLLRDRRVSLAVMGVAAVQVAAVWAGVGGWPCPLKSALGIPCPGCGLTRASVALLRGEFAAAFSLHAFAPLLLLGLAAFAVAGLLPAAPREAFAGMVWRVERHTNAAYVVLAALLLYWSGRLLFMPGSFNR
ncbi:MAG: hypothetical protein QOH49_1856 [Acidobacteriota bacterium]|jgi:hypothetical protein|nr:hypothetical protein [Acidobacteriota bacterium]